MKLIALEMVLKARMRSRRANEQMDSIPHHVEWTHVKVERRRNATKVVHVLDGVHAKTCERFNVGVAVVKAVDVSVLCVFVLGSVFTVTSTTKHSCDKGVVVLI
jgi:hypothetical protein